MEETMRILILALGLIALAMPAFADCGATHQASTPNTVATTNPPAGPAPNRPSGG
jgi:predicted S18 family serine protease